MRSTRPTSSRSSYADHYIDQERFVRNANLMLDAVLVFWRGLDIQRTALAAEERIHAKTG